ncbi:hypothetical protein K438DRAFT_1787397 [Mycena galopus ATCC 62051]|nr:hypothetical protein K438DRAFT_1787397 [Mycena galopus ATCC 62051]
MTTRFGKESKYLPYSVTRHLTIKPYGRGPLDPPGFNNSKKTSLCSKSMTPLFPLSLHPIYRPSFSICYPFFRSATSAHGNHVGSRKATARMFKLMIADGRVTTLMATHLPTTTDAVQQPVRRAHLHASSVTRQIRVPKKPRHTAYGVCTLACKLGRHRENEGRGGGIWAHADPSKQLVQSEPTVRPTAGSVAASLPLPASTPLPRTAS